MLSSVFTALTLRPVSSLEKIFSDSDVFPLPACTSCSALRGETLSFQIAYRMDPCRHGNVPFEDGRYRITVRGSLGAVTIRKVCLVPSMLPAYPDHDSNYLRTAPGLFPDLLSEDGCTQCAPEAGSQTADPSPICASATIHALPSCWQSLWIDVEIPAIDSRIPGTASEIPEIGAAIPGDTPAGLHILTICADDLSGSRKKEFSITIEVIDAALPKLPVIHTEWFSYDCIADYYGTPPFSERFWSITEAFIRTAVRRNINTILTPIFTPPLDTAVGGERTPVQLVGISRTDGVWKFDFSKLKRFVSLCLRLGIEYFEMAHLFTQWGAKCAPNIYAEENGRMIHVFGWHTPACGEDYRRFLDAFLPALTSELRALGIADRTWFHISDEPSADTLEDYKAAKAMVAGHLDGFPVIDALSHVEYYRQGICSRPVPGTDHVHEFIREQVPGLWTYYCCAQGIDVSNVFFAMPSARNRILGVQLYLYRIAGFLHWGYNFYHSALSLHPVNPFVTTDADGAFPSGDAFLVYPGKDGRPLESIRLMVQSEAFQDLRALTLLESRIGFEAVRQLIEEDFGPITFYSYPKSPEYLLALRRKVNQRLKETNPSD